MRNIIESELEAIHLDEMNAMDNGLIPTSPTQKDLRETSISEEAENRRELKYIRLLETLRT